MPLTNSPARKPPQSGALQSASHLEERFLRLARLSSLPALTRPMIQAAGSAADVAASRMAFAALVQKDSTLSMRILRIANSPYCAPGEPIEDLAQAVEHLGSKQLRNLAAAVHVARLAAEPWQIAAYSREGLWKHLTAVAEVAQLVAQVCPRLDPEEAFLAGLFHDIGILLIDKYLPGAFEKVMDRVTAGQAVFEAEQEVHGFDHTDLGGFIARQCGAPEAVVDAVQCHHRPDEYQGPHGRLLRALAVANYIVSRSGCTATGTLGSDPPSDATYRGIGLGRVELSTICQRLEATRARGRLLSAI